MSQQSARLLVCFGLICLLPNRLDAEAAVYKLPGQYSQFAWGGAGRFVAFHMESGKVLVYDLSEKRPERAFEIPDVPAGDLLAGSSEKLVIVSPSKMIIRRWDFEAKKRDKIAIIDGNDPPQMAAMGFAGKGPLLIVGREGSHVFDLETLKPLKVKGRMMSGTGRYGLSVHVSPDGATFGTIPAGYGPVGYAAWHLQDNQVSLHPFGGTSNAIRWAQPSGDGYLLMLPGGEVFNRNGRRIEADWLKGSTMIPTPDPSFVLDVRLDQKLPTGETLGKVTIRSTADCKPVDFEMGFEELVPARILRSHDIRNALELKGNWRIQYLPEQNQIITLPAGNDRIVSRPWNVLQKLKSEKRDYFYLTSIPPLSVQVGKTLDYRIQVQSSGKKVRISLEDGPDGAELTRKNQLKWTVPEGYAETWARFLLTITNAEGQELFHSFEVAIHPLKNE